jgi:type IV pilus assembly protein PilM
MAAPQTIWGIDIGRCALKAMRLRAAGEDKVELLAWDYVEHPKILTQPDANRDELISNALEKFLSRNDLSRDRVVVSVPGQHTLARFTKLPPVAEKKIPDIVRYEADQQIPFDMDEVIWDYQIFRREGFPDVEVGIFAMRRELVREHLLHFEQASVEPVIVQCGPLAVYNAAYFDDWLGDDTTILLDIGAESTDLIIGTPHGLWTRTIAIGGNNFTEALVKSFKLSFSKAENLKRTAATSKYARQVFQAMRPVFADLMQELQRSIGFYSSTHREAEIQRVVCVGNACKLPGLQKYLEQNLGLTVVRPEKFQNLSETSASGAPQFAEQILSFGVAYGLAVQGLEYGKITSNLLPTELAKHLVWRKKRPTFATAAACLVLAGGLVAFRYSSDLNALQTGGGDWNNVRLADVRQAAAIVDGGPTLTRAPRAQAKEVLAAGQLLRGALSKLSSLGTTEEQQVTELVGLQENKVIIPRIVRMIHDSVPPSAALSSGAPAPGPSDAPSAGMARRDQRREVYIQELEMMFEPDTNVLTVWQYNLVGKDAETAFHDDLNEVLPGIFILIRCRTPNSGGAEFIHDTFMETLRKAGRQPDLGFYINRLYLVDGIQLSAEQADRRGTRGSRTPSRPSRDRGITPPAARLPGLPLPGASQEAGAGPVAYNAAAAEKVDPLTGEPTGDDWRFEIAMDLILGPLPETATEEPAPDEQGAEVSDDG